MTDAQTPRDDEGPADALDQLALKGLAGRLTTEEAARLDVLCAASPDALKRVEALAEVWMLGAVAAVKPETARTSLPRLDRRWVVGMAAALVATVGLGLWLNRPPGSIVYEAPADALRIVRLSDGSVVTLSRGGRLEAAFDGDRRALHQVRGEALYAVVHDPNRPFVVTAQRHRLTVLGTRFNVSPGTEGLRVDLLEGRLRVVAEGDSGPGVVLRPGETFRQNGVPTVAVLDAEGAAAWTQGRLIFDDVTLAEVASRVERHTGRRIVFDAPAAASLRFSGVLAVDRPSEWATALDSVLPVETRPVADGLEVGLRP